LLKLKDAEPTACCGAPIFYNYSSSNEEYSPISTTPSSQNRGGLKDEGATTYREAPVLHNHSQPDDHPESFSGSHLSLTITSTLQSSFMYWKGLEPSEPLEYDSRLVAESTLRRINPWELEDFDYSAQLQLMSQHRHAAATTSTTRLARAVTTASTNRQRQRLLQLLVSTRN
jgi:hypothetical protein